MISTAPALALLDRTRDLRYRATQRPLDYVRFTPPQLALLRCRDRRILLRTGNQVGKTWGLCAELIFRARGRHPYKPVPPAPVKITLVTASWKQSVAIQGKLWDLLPQDEIDPDTEYDPIRGFRGAHPAVRFRNGSIIRIKTSRQGGLSLAGETVDVVAIDEPVAQVRVYAELERRLTRTGGTLIMTLTPVNAPVEWLREQAEAGRITDLHYRMTPDVFIPEGWTHPLQTSDGRYMDAAWIAEQRAAVLPYEAPVVIDGEWETSSVDRVFEAFRPDLHVVPGLLSSDVRPTGEVAILVGVDYGEDRLRTAAVEVYCDDSGEHTRIWVVAEYAPNLPSTIEMDARSILGMLASRGDRWSDVDEAWGDKRYTDARGKATKKSNGMLLHAIGEEIKAGGDPRPLIRSSKKGPNTGKGAVWRGVRWLHDCMIRPGHFYVDASCRWLIESLLKWDGTTDSPHKDVIDALRYALRSRITPVSQNRARIVYRRM